MYTVYILFSANLDRYYVGHTDDMVGRLRRHLTDHTGYTSKAKDWEVVFIELFQDRLSAGRREREIKSWKSAVRIRELLRNRG